MHWAVNNKSESCVRILIGRVDLSIENQVRKTKINLVRYQSRVYSIARVLSLSLASHADLARILPSNYKIDTPDEAGTSLILAYENGQFNIARQLLKLDGINFPIKDEQDGIDVGVQCKRLSLVDAILDQNDSYRAINEKYQTGQTALAQASSTGNASVVERLLQETNIDINATAEGGETALTLACSFGCTYVVTQLLALSPDRLYINWLILSGNTALAHAASEGHEGIVQILLQFPGIDAIQETTPGVGILEKKHYSVVHQLLLASDACDPQEYVELLSNLGTSMTHELAMKLLFRDLPFELIGGTLTPRSLQQHSWTNLLDRASDVPSHFRISCFQALVASPQYDAFAKDVCQELAFATDQDGRKAIEITDATTRSYLFSQLYFCSRYELFQGPPVHVSNTAVVVMAYDHGLCAQAFDEYAKHGELTQDEFVICSQLLGRLTAERMAATQKKRLRAKEAWEMEFRLWDSDNSGKISNEEFLKYGAKYFGGKVKKNRSLMSDNFALQCLPAVDEATFQACVAHLTINDDMNMSSYRHLLGQSIGAKFSSGILPPELIHELKSNDEVAAYEAYWADYREDKMVWNKIKPKKKIVVKSFRPEMDWTCGRLGV
ncbi:Aste57867_5408 [Aphanomyces stellatus]|uniref:Aste57867_5408 protein n=1 Tax=Aphanomyces stellatus TaxID=120398 RepID=A0A485KH01_9STRA|nr:hypothetical protein As57867_005395 [Aphanomyces stellatus]VFT82464.1 Aste57867_5408 [Aphanomyces stellatus]